MAILDDTASGVPLPHPDNPAKLDAGRIRDALTALDARQVEGGDDVSALQEAIEDEVTARQMADAEEANDRTDAIAAEAAARLAADLALAEAIDDIPEFDGSIFYTKTEVDGLFAGVPSSGVLSALAARLSYVELMSLWNTGGTVDVFADGFHSIAGTAVVDAAATSDATISASVTEGLSSNNPTLPFTPASNASPAGYTFAMSPAPTVASDEYKAMAYTSGTVSTAANTAFTFEVTPPTSRVVDNWFGTATLGAARSFTLFFEGFTGGSWATLDSINFSATTNGSVNDNPGRTISPQTNTLYSKFRWRVAITSGGATTLTWDGLGCVAFIKPVVQSNAFTAMSAPATIRVDVDAQFSVGGALQASDLVAEVSRDGGTTWIAVPLTLYPGASSGFGTLKYPCYGTVTMTGPSGTAVKWRISQAARLVSTTKRLQINSVMLRWT